MFGALDLEDMPEGPGDAAVDGRNRILADIEDDQKGDRHARFDDSPEPMLAIQHGPVLGDGDGLSVLLPFTGQHGQCIALHGRLADIAVHGVHFQPFGGQIGGDFDEFRNNFLHGVFSLY